MPRKVKKSAPTRAHAELDKLLADERDISRVLQDQSRELRERIAARDTAIDGWRAHNAKMQEELVILRNLQAKAQHEQWKTADLIHDLTLLQAQSCDTLCGSRWMNAAGFHLALKRYAEDR